MNYITLKTAKQLKEWGCNFSTQKYWNRYSNGLGGNKGELAQLEELIQKEIYDFELLNFAFIYKVEK